MDNTKHSVYSPNAIKIEVTEHYFNVGFAHVDDQRKVTDEVHLSIEPTDALFFAEQILNAFKEHQKNTLKTQRHSQIWEMKKMQSTQTSKQANGYKIAPVNSTADGLKLLEQLQKTKTESEFLECMKELYCTAVRHEQLDESGFISEKQRAQMTGWLKNSDEDNTIDELERCVDNLNKLLVESHPNLEKGFTSEEYKLFFSTTHFV